jgi:hypothetical protein
MGMDLLFLRSIAMVLVKREVLLCDDVGLVTILWAVLWFVIVSESPSTHSTITSDELTYIESNRDGTAIRVNLLRYA